jgi:putative hydrolase of the HAD superfamily
LLREGGGQWGHERFLDVWSAVSARFDQESAVDDREFSMADAATAFLREAPPQEPSPGTGGGVRRGLPRRVECRGAQLAALGVLATMDAVVLSVDVGRRKLTRTPTGRRCVNSASPRRPSTRRAL